MNITFPLQFDSYGHIADCEQDEHIRDMMEQILFTLPGERVNRPDFGCGVQMLVFSAIQPELLSVKQNQIQAEIQRYLGHLLRLNKVEISAQDSQLSILIEYLSFARNQTQSVVFKR